MTGFQWADQLVSRKSVVVFAGVTHTLQREIREVKFECCRHFSFITHFLQYLSDRVILLTHEGLHRDWILFQRAVFL